MAKARKCDRCGAFYQIPLDNIRNTVVFEHYTSTKRCSLDLCDDCHNELVNWLKAKENKTKC